MITRSLSKTVAFRKPFHLKGIDRVLPAGDYRVVTDEELIEGLSFPVYRRVATMMAVPKQACSANRLPLFCGHSYLFELCSLYLIAAGKG